MDEGIRPPYLKQNDKVLLISPASKIDRKLIKGMFNRLKSWGLRPIIGKHASAKSGTFSGSIRQRLSDLQYGLDHKSIKAIFCTRGGYGTIQLIQDLCFDKFKKTPKWLIGYSDVTVLHNIIANYNINSVHGPMARHFTMAPKEDLSLELLKKALFGEQMNYIIKGHKYNQKGDVKGRLIGGNLTILASLLSTNLNAVRSGDILYIEDINENSNQVERMLYSFQLSGMLNYISGVIIGQFTWQYKREGEQDKVYQRINRLIKHLRIPIAYNFPIGHGDVNYPLVNGSLVHFVVRKSVVELNFI